MGIIKCVIALLVVLLCNLSNSYAAIQQYTATGTITDLTTPFQSKYENHQIGDQINFDLRLDYSGARSESFLNHQLYIHDVAADYTITFEDDQMISQLRTVTLHVSSEGAPPEGMGDTLSASIDRLGFNFNGIDHFPDTPWIDPADPLDLAMYFNESGKFVYREIEAFGQTNMTVHLNPLVAMVPEPASLSLMSVCIFALSIRKRK